MRRFYETSTTTPNTQLHLEVLVGYHALLVPIARVTKWLQSQSSYTLHKPARRAGYKTRPYRTSGIDHQWQMDLVDMIQESKHNEGYKHILTVIDIFSRYAWAEPLKTKSPRHVMPALRSIFAQGRKPTKVQSDQGLEFESKVMKTFFTSLGIEQFSVKSQFKAAIVERFNRTLKNKMFSYFTFANTHKWLDILPKLIEGYNKAKHRSIEMAPQDVDSEEEIPLWLNQNDPPPKLNKHGEGGKISNRGIPRLLSRNVKIGDYVRISKVKSVFGRGFLPNWTEEVFTVSKIVNTTPKQYKLNDESGEEVEGSFYREEIQVVDKPTEYRIEKVVQTKRVNGAKQHLIKWLGYPASFNSWVSEDAIRKL